MVKRLLPFLVVFVFVFILSVPCFAYDVVQTESDAFGFSFDDSKIYFCEKAVVGSNISVDNQFTSVSRIYFYIPCNKPVVSLDFIFTLTKLTGAVNYNSCDYGYVQSNNYSIIASMPAPSVTWLGTNYIEGSSAQVNSFKVAFTSVPFTDNSAHRYIRLTFDTSTSLVNWLQKRLDQNLSGVLSNPTYSLSATQGDHVGTVSSGSLTESGYYITGNIKSKYYNGSSVATNTGTLSSGTTGSGGYLWVPSHTISATASSPLKMNISGGNISGSLTPSSSSQDTDLSGTYLSREYLSPVVMTATRSYSDADLIEAVNDASDRNHDDLGRIEDQMQEIVDHMQGLEQQGNEINATTSQATINNASSVVSTGTSSMSDTANYVSSGVASGYAEGQGYINLLSYGVEEMVEFGSASKPVGVWLWAIIFIPVAFFIFRRISE